jgi:rRNA maturation endonuclease Nob1
VNYFCTKCQERFELEKKENCPDCGTNTLIEVWAVVSDTAFEDITGLD